MIGIIAIGSAVGGVARYLIGLLGLRWFGVGYPVGTLFVNLTGSLLIGFVMRYATEPGSLSNAARAFLVVGICGGYTTFSAFSYETIGMLQNGAVGKAAGYMVASVSLALAGTLVGMGLASSLIELRRLG